MNRTTIAILFGTVFIFSKAAIAQTIDDATVAIETDEPVAAKEFVLPEHLEATIWARALMFYNTDEYRRRSIRTHVGH